MAMRKKLELTWGGESYPMLVTMETIDRVEDKISIGGVLARQLTGDVRFSHDAKFIAIVLNEAGAIDATQESVYEYMFSDGAVSMAETKELLSLILSAFFPESKKKDSSAKKKSKIK